MRGGTIGMGLRGLFAVVTTVAALGCGPSPITSTRIEGAIAPTFANLVQVQVSRLGLPPMAASDFAVTASCRKLVAGSDRGAGDWACTLVWHGPRNQSLTRHLRPLRGHRRLLHRHCRRESNSAGPRSRRRTAAT